MGLAQQHHQGKSWPFPRIQCEHRSDGGCCTYTTSELLFSSFFLLFFGKVPAKQLKPIFVFKIWRTLPPPADKYDPWKALFLLLITDRQTDRQDAPGPRLTCLFFVLFWFRAVWLVAFYFLSSVTARWSMESDEAVSECFLVIESRDAAEKRSLSSGCFLCSFLSFPFNSFVYFFIQGEQRLSVA